MSFPRDEDGAFAKLSWPTPLKDRIELVDGVGEAKFWQVVPVTFEEICDWAYVSVSKVSNDQTRRHLVLYRSPEATLESVVYPVTLRVQGFIERAKLIALGDWDGNRSTAMRAMQHLTLSCGGHLKPWLAFQTAIRHIRQLVHNTIGGPKHLVETVQRPNELMHFQRRVFTKVAAGGNDASDVLTPADDPEDRCSVLNGEWVVAEKLQIGRVLDNGDTIQCSPLALSEGDFVDIGLSFDIALAKSHNGQRRVRVFLCMEHVLQLLPRTRTAEYLPGREHQLSTRNEAHVYRAPAQILKSGLSFREEVHTMGTEERDEDELMI